MALQQSGNHQVATAGQRTRSGNLQEAIPGQRTRSGNLQEAIPGQRTRSGNLQAEIAEQGPAGSDLFSVKGRTGLVRSHKLNKPDCDLQPSYTAFGQCMAAVVIKKYLFCMKGFML